MTHDSLVAALLDIERHVNARGWDQPARLFALVPTAELLGAEPALAAHLAAPAAAPDDTLTAVEQDTFRAGADLMGDLERVAWPPTVSGCALAVERLFVPPEVEPDIPDDPDDAASFVAHHPRRHDLRVVVGVTRAGASHGVARVKDTPTDLLGGEDLAPGLARILAQTLE